MINTGKLAGRTIFITGASRGIGKAIALKAAKDGANIVIAAKTADPHPKLAGTIYSAAKEVEEAGGKCLPCVVDVRDETQVAKAVESAVAKFGGIDILVNNASSISLTSTLSTEMKRYDLMHSVNVRGTFLVSKICLPHLKKGKSPQILNISPPLNMNPMWFKNHVAYTMTKYGMSMCVLGMAEEFRQDGIAVNALWPKTAILTAAMELLTGQDAAKHSRKPEIMGDAAYAIFQRDVSSCTGKFLIDEDVLKDSGITDFDSYACDPSNQESLMPDFFLDTPPEEIALKKSGGGGEGGAAGAAGDFEKIFKAIQNNLSEELVSKVQASYLFNLKGDQAGTYFVDLKTGKGSAGKGDPPSPPDATLTMTAKDFSAMFLGKLKPAAAFMTGKLKISGNLQKAMKLEKLMGQLKSKL